MKKHRILISLTLTFATLLLLSNASVFAMVPNTGTSLEETEIIAELDLAEVDEDGNASITVYWQADENGRISLTDSDVSSYAAYSSGTFTAYVNNWI